MKRAALLFLAAALFVASPAFARYGDWYLVINVRHEPAVIVGPFDSQRECMQAWQFDHQHNYGYRAERVSCVQQRD